MCVLGASARQHEDVEAFLAPQLRAFGDMRADVEHLCMRETAKLRVAPRENRQEIDKSPFRAIRYFAKSLSELVELTGIEPVTS